VNGMFIGPEEIEWKRRQQERLSDTLLQQIEERRRARALEEAAIARREAANAPVAAPPEALPARPARLLWRPLAATLPPRKPLPVIPVATESPFAMSTVATPPIGFRRTHTQTPDCDTPEPPPPARPRRPRITAEIIYPDGRILPLHV
jgi:hypothetical protein